MSSAFISHSSIDKPFVRRLREDLEASGVTTWLDEDQILPGQSFVERISQGLESNDHVLLVVSKSFLASEWSLWETNASIASVVGGKGNHLIPVLLDDVWEEVPSLLRDKVYVDFRKAGNVVEYRHAVGLLLNALLGRKASPLIKAKAPVVLVTGGRDPKYNALAFQVAYEFGKLLGAGKQQMICGVAQGVDESFCRGASESLEALGEDPHRFLTCYCGRGRASFHKYGQQIMSVFSRREEGVPELVTDADVVVLFGGSKNTQYMGVLALLENKVVFPVAATGGAAADLFTIILGRYERIYGDRLARSRFQALANINATPVELAQRTLGLMRECT